MTRRFDSAPLSGLRVAYAAFEPFPNAKGSGTRITQMVRALAEAGARVRLITLDGSEGGGGLHPSVEHVRWLGHERNLLRRGQAFRAFVARTLTGTAPDVVHYRGLFEAEATEVLRSSRVRRIFEVNGLYSVELSYHYPAVAHAEGFLRRLREREAAALVRADRVFTQSQTTRAYLAGRVSERPLDVRVIANGADPETRPPRPRLEGEPTRLLYAGTLAPWQGVAELLMATRRLAKLRPVELTLAGPVRRRWRRQLTRAVRRLSLSDCVRLLGPISRERLADQMLQADVCLAPLRRDARNARQGSSPIKLFEYMAASRPIVSTDLPCVREILEPLSTGLLATSTRPSALYEAVATLIDQPGLALRLGEAAREALVQRMTWAHRRARVVALYEELLGSA